MSSRLTAHHLQRKALLYIRQSSQHQVLHNRESGLLQYAMKERLEVLGWREIEVIDDDLGLSGTTTAKRKGFERMVAEVCLGKVGVVAAREVSRFARNSRDWHQLVEMCSLVGTLLVDHESLYDPRWPNDRLLLGLKGSMSEYEIDLLRQRSLAARWAKARRGELVIQAPIGYVKTADQRLEKDPNRRVQRAIELVFTKFFELGSGRQVLMWFLDQGLELPAKRHGPDGWETWWRRPAYRMVAKLLTEPTYAGAYAYGRTTGQTEIIEGVVHKKRVRKPLDEWSVLLPDHHEGYISWEQFQRAQCMLTNNASQFFRKGSPGAVKKGVALLPGLVRCGMCGLKLTVDYSGRNATVPRYICRRGSLDNGEPRCLSVGGLGVDEVLAREVLRVLRPCAVEAAEQAVADEAAKEEAVVQALLLELEATRYSAERARRQYDAVDPDNRLVADELEKRWNTTLAKVGDVERRVELARANRPESLPEPGEFANLEREVTNAWADPGTDVRLKKRIIRTLIEQVILSIDEATNELELVVHWKGGVHSVLRTPRRRRGTCSAHTSPNTVDAIRVLAKVCSDDMIASSLNRDGHRTGRGNRWTRQRVASARSKRKILGHTAERQQVGGWLKLGEAALYAGVCAKTLRRAVERGVISALHPVAHGPWVFDRSELDAMRGQIRVREEAAGPLDQQLNLVEPSKQRGAGS